MKDRYECLVGEYPNYHHHFINFISSRCLNFAIRLRLSPSIDIFMKKISVSSPKRPAFMRTPVAFRIHLGSVSILGLKRISASGRLGTILREVIVRIQGRDSN